MSAINKTIFHAIVLWLHVGIGPMIGSGPMQPRQWMRNGVGRRGSAAKRPKTAAGAAAFANPKR
jgi:hypothetical protein